MTNAVVWYNVYLLFSFWVHVCTFGVDSGVCILCAVRACICVYVCVCC